MTTLPAGWTKRRIGDALTLINGRAFKPSDWKPTGIPIVRIQNLNNADAPFNHYDRELPEKFLLGDGDLLFAWSGTPGTSFGAHIWRGGKAWLNQHIFKVLFDERDFDKRFLQLAINQNLNEYIRKAHGGAGLAHITKGRFEESELVKPPLPEQRRIVGEIEKQFTRLEAGVAALRRVQANLHRYRAAVLKAAIPATGTPQVRLEELAEKGVPVLYGILQPGPGVPDGIPYVRPTEIDQDSILLEQIRRTSPAIAAKYKRSVLKAGDIILSIVGTIGKVAIVPASLEGGNITQSSVRIRPDRTQVGEKYLAWVLRSPFAIKQYDAARLGTAVPRLNVAHVRDLLIPVPPVAEQERIVAEVERRLSVVEELSALVTANLQRATRLRQSILQQAFEGKLI